MIGICICVMASKCAQSRDRYQSAADMLEEISVLMVREGHRATNNDLAAYVRNIIESDKQKREEAPAALAGNEIQRLLDEQRTTDAESAMQTAIVTFGEQQRFDKLERRIANQPVPGRSGTPLAPIPYSPTSR